MQLQWPPGRLAGADASDGYSQPVPRPRSLASVFQGGSGGVAPAGILADVCSAIGRRALVGGTAAFQGVPTMPCFCFGFFYIRSTHMGVGGRGHTNGWVGKQERRAGKESRKGGKSEQLVGPASHGTAAGQGPNPRVVRVQSLSSQPPQGHPVGATVCTHVRANKFRTTHGACPQGSSRCASGAWSRKALGGVEGGCVLWVGGKWC